MINQHWFSQWLGVQQVPRHYLDQILSKIYIAYKQWFILTILYSKNFTNCLTEFKDSLRTSWKKLNAIRGFDQRWRRSGLGGRSAPVHVWLRLRRAPRARDDWCMTTISNPWWQNTRVIQCGTHRGVHQGSMPSPSTAIPAFHSQSVANQAG